MFSQKTLCEIALFASSQPVSQKALDSRVNAMRELLYQLPLPAGILARFHFSYRYGEGFLWLVVGMHSDRQMALFPVHGPGPVSGESHGYVERSMTTAWEEASSVLHVLASRARLSPAELSEILPRDSSRPLGATLLAVLANQPGRRLVVRQQNQERCLEFPEMALRWTSEETRSISAQVHMVGRTEAVIVNVRDLDHDAPLHRRQIGLFWGRSLMYHRVGCILHAAVEKEERIHLAVRETRSRLTAKLERFEFAGFVEKTKK